MGRCGRVEIVLSWTRECVVAWMGRHGMGWGSGCVLDSGSLACGMVGLCGVVGGTGVGDGSVGVDVG